MPSTQLVTFMVVSRDLGGWAPVESRTSIKYGLESVVQGGGAATLHRQTPSLGHHGTQSCWDPTWPPGARTAPPGSLLPAHLALGAGDSFLLGSETLSELSSGPLSVLRSRGLAQWALTGYGDPTPFVFSLPGNLTAWFPRSQITIVSVLWFHDYKPRPVLES